MCASKQLSILLMADCLTHVRVRLAHAQKIRSISGYNYFIMTLIIVTLIAVYEYIHIDLISTSLLAGNLFFQERCCTVFVMYENRCNLNWSIRSNTSLLQNTTCFVTYIIRTKLLEDRCMTLIL